MKSILWSPIFIKAKIKERNWPFGRIFRSTCTSTDECRSFFVFPRKIAFDQYDFIDATDFYLRGWMENAWVVEQKISWTYTQVYIEHNEILLCIYSVVVNDPKMTSNDFGHIHYRDMIGWFTFDSHWFKNRETNADSSKVCLCTGTSYLAFYRFWGL